MMVSGAAAKDWRRRWDASALSGQPWGCHDKGDRSSCLCHRRRRRSKVKEKVQEKKRHHGHDSCSLEEASQVQQEADADDLLG
jgi:hypothetical protein